MQEQMTANGKPWEQLPGEPAAAYARFLTYKGLGPARSARAAYEVYRKSSGEAEPAAEAAESYEKRAVPGSWIQDMRRWRWKDRAELSDLDALEHVGFAAVVLYTHALAELANWAYSTIAAKPADATIGEILQVFDRLNDFIPPETRLEVLDSIKRTGAAVPPGGTPRFAPDPPAANGEPHSTPAPAG